MKSEAGICFGEASEPHACRKCHSLSIQHCLVCIAGHPRNITRGISGPDIAALVPPATLSHQRCAVSQAAKMLALRGVSRFGSSARALTYVAHASAIAARDPLSGCCAAEQAGRPVPDLAQTSSISSNIPPAFAATQHPSGRLAPFGCGSANTALLLAAGSRGFAKGKRGERSKLCGGNAAHFSSVLCGGETVHGLQVYRSAHQHAASNMTM